MLHSIARFVIVASFVTGKDIVKEVVYTPWWTNSSGQGLESVGIKSHGFVFMTSMMSVNETWQATLDEMVNDVRDIANGGGIGLDDLVACLLNTPKNMGTLLHGNLLRALPENSTPAITVVEMGGEYQFTPTSLFCRAALDPEPGAIPRRTVEIDSSAGPVRGVAANGLLHIQGVTGHIGGIVNETLQALDIIDTIVRKAGGGSLNNSLVDCTAFLSHITDSELFRTTMRRYAAPAITIAQAGSIDKTKHVTLQCVAAIPTRAGEKSGDVILTRTEQFTATDKLVFASAQLGKRTDGTDSFQKLQAVLQEAGTDLSKVVECLFFLPDNKNVSSLFGGFYKVFNKANPPPPTREELESVLEGGGRVSAKCIAALAPRSSSSGSPISI